ncbi:carbamoyltransferase C-terminal domain-containing protein [Candidatus Pelagibacter ubique]|nr:carbamoyltransferase C-terminal domain-containing protein [Candidatus Pelagibacter ubique]
MIILGINYKHGDASACLIKDGKLLSAIEEERFVKIKNYSYFPINSIKYCLAENNTSIDEVNYITVNSNQTYNFFTKIIFVLKNLNNPDIFNYISSLLKKEKKITIFFKYYFNQNIRDKIIYIPHHLAHVYSTLFFLEDTKNSLALSFDGSGDFSTIELYLVNQKKLKLLEKNYFPHSLGFFYTAFTQYLGFNNYGDEYKVMGLSGTGSPIYSDMIKKLLIKSEYPFRLNLKYFNLPKVTYIKHQPNVNTLFNKLFIETFGKPRINNKENIEKIYRDYAASMQKVFEDVIFAYLYKFQKEYNSKKLYLTGGCALNSVLVGKIVETKLFDEVDVGPNPGDAGGALGSAFCHLAESNLKIASKHNIPFSGPSYKNSFIKKYIIDKIINDKKFKVSFYEKDEDLTLNAAKIIKKQKIIFWYQDATEWGPRALGNRSILADPTEAHIKNIINLAIKKRELFRPFAPVVLKNYANDYFHMHGQDSKYMNIVFKAKDTTVQKFPGIVHEDGTSRVQTIEVTDNRKIYNLLTEYNKITGCPILINTSLNIQGPMAMSPMDAFNFFLDTDLKSIILNNWLIEVNQ